MLASEQVDEGEGKGLGVRIQGMTSERDYADRTEGVTSEHTGEGEGNVQDETGVKQEGTGDRTTVRLRN